MSEILIQFRDVKKAFGEKIIYRGLNLTMHRGEVLTVLGGSGVGKSVMLKMLIGLLKADSGSIIFDGDEVTTMKEGQLARVRQRIAMLFQSGALFDSLTVGENVGLVRIYARREDGVLIGAEMFGPRVEHTAHLLAWVMQCGLTVNEVLDLPYYHPVIEEGIRTAVRDLCASLRIRPPEKPRDMECGPGA